jgi:DNA mismatch endonuclease (patch repair protein)
MPKSRLEFWRSKLYCNRDRDLRNQRELIELGWKCMVVWEFQISNIEELNKNIVLFLEDG